MAARYRKVDPRMWDDEKFLAMSPTEKLIAVYIITAQSNRIGIFRFSVGLALEHLGIDSETFAIGFGNVCRTLNWVFDRTRRIVYFPTWWKYNLPDNVNVFKSCLDDLHDLPQSELIQQFASNSRYLPETYAQTLAKRLPNVSPQEQEQEQEQEPKARDKKFDQTPEGLATAWTFYSTRKKGRAKADATDEAAPIMAELIRQGKTPAALLAEIERKDRDRTEYLWQFKARILGTNKNGAAPQGESDDEIAARQKASRDHLERLKGGRS